MRRPAPFSAAARRLGRDRSGATSVEFAILAWPLVALILMACQVAIHQYTVLMLSNTLFDTAATPQVSVLAGNQSGYKSDVCAKLPFMTTKTCESSLLVEMAPLSAVPTAAQAIQGTVFSSGLPMNVLVLRASVPILRVFPALPKVSAQASVVFRRP
ncbi:hypothetical protein ASG52_17955 [Methylobacterium sp. Leaf456]|uniref:TadE/TadG family type IV pilus assembly protein n=1 Tax=Methylobacterium sp. Leaf456 TaxID=1736382 RepID=UPI0006F2A076|nr:TadE/TadG family type IV pilus assembly protein [Methylobacterium sp. Leaf456]KQT61113.1 hypothetical protein ASG52_17955 [Methylobacterium sp. Leaf456]